MFFKKYLDVVSVSQFCITKINYNLVVSFVLHG